MSIANPNQLVDQVVNELCPVLVSLVPKSTKLPAPPFPLSIAQNFINMTMDQINGAMAGFVHVRNNLRVPKIIIQLIYFLSSQQLLSVVQLFGAEIPGVNSAVTCLGSLVDKLTGTTPTAR
jgi:hypothetical protein